MNLKENKMNQGNIRKHSYNANFTVIPNSIAQDNELSWEERGMLLFLQSLPQDWKIYKSSLHNFAKNGDTNTRRVFDNLVEKGYIITNRIKGEDGKFVGYEHIFDMTKQFGEELQIDGVGKPHIGKTNIGQSPTTKEIIPTKEKEKKEINEDLLKLEFDKFKRMYKGEGKRGLDKEWDYFKKKHKNYAEIVPTLVGLYEKYLEYRKQKEARKEFVPPHKNFSTYVNNACWEEMYEVKLDSEQSKTTDDIEKYRSMRGFDEQIHLCGKYYPHVVNDQNGKRIKYIPHGFNP